MPAPGEVTRLLRAYEAGDSQAFDRLVPMIYDEMRRIARGRLHRGAGVPAFDTTSLVHEAYLKLAGAEQLHAVDRAHLMAIASTAIRQVLVDRARSQLRAKRGGGEATVGLDEVELPVGPPSEWLLDLDRALSMLRRRDERCARVFDCRFFADLSDAETAEALDMPVRTVQRDWMRARAWLRAELATPRADGP